MTRWFSLLFLFVLPVLAVAQGYHPVDESSSVKFRIKNLGFNVTGSFSGLKGDIRFNPSNYSECSFNVEVDAKTVNTGNGMRDGHLKKEDYFDTENFPAIKFVSTKVTGSNKAGTLFIFGRLTIKGTTKDISFPFKATPRTDGYAFEGSFTINRRDFKVGGGSTISDKLTVLLNVVVEKS